MNNKGLFIRIICMVFIIVFSYYLWDFNDNEKSAALAASFNDMDVFVYVEEPDSLSIVSSDNALDFVEPTSLILRNKNDFTKSVKIVLLISKNSTIDKNDIEIALDEEIFLISKQDYEEDENNYYVFLKNIDIESYSSVEFESRIWIKDSITNLPENAFLTTNYIVK